MTDPQEYRFTMPDGSFRHEFASDVREAHQIKRGIGATGFASPAAIARLHDRQIDREADRLANMLHPSARNRRRSPADLSMMAVALADARGRLAIDPHSVRDAAIVRYYQRLTLTPAERQAIGL